MRRLLLILSLWVPAIAPGQSSLPRCPADKTQFHMCWGELLFPNRMFYTGEFKFGSADGWGISMAPDGSIYVGEFNQNARVGQGAFTSAEGTRDVGQFRSGRLHGEGIRYSSKGEVLRSGLWLNGELRSQRALDSKKYPFEASVTEPVRSSIAEASLEVRRQRYELERRLSSDALTIRERDAQEKAEQERLAKEKAEQDRLAREKAEKEARDRAEQTRLAQVKADREAKELEERRQQAIEQVRRDVLERMQKQLPAASGSGDSGSRGSAQVDAAPSQGYASLLVRTVRPNIVLTETPAGNPAAVVEVRAGPSGTVVSRRLVQSSGIPSWDEAVMRAIDRTGTLPRDVDGRVPPVIEMVFRPRD